MGTTETSRPKMTTKKLATDAPKRVSAGPDGNQPQQHQRQIGLFHAGRQRGGQQRQPEIGGGFFSRARNARSTAAKI